MVQQIQVTQRAAPRVSRKKCSNYAGTVTFQPRVGDKARADARIILEGVKGVISQASTSQSNNVIWQSMSNSGSNIETLLMPSFIGPNTPVFAGPLTVQIPAGDFKTQVQTLSSQPGMSYLNALTQRSDVNWQAIKLAHEQWNYSQEGLTPAGAALLSVAVAWATAGTGASLVGGTVSTTTTVAGVATTTTVTTTAGMMANAAFSSLAAQASISLINNKGDVGKTLKELGSSNTVQNMIVAAGVAGVTSYTDNWGTTLTDNGNKIVTDWAKRSQAYMLNTAAKGTLTGASSSNDWWTVAGLGFAGEAYQYWVGRAADVRPGVDRQDGPKYTSLQEGDLYRVPREMVNGVLREGKNIGFNDNTCSSLISVCHGTPTSNALNTLPGFNAFATLHDTWGEWLAKDKAWNLVTNLGSMPPALLVTYSSLTDQYGYINSKRK